MGKESRFALRKKDYKISKETAHDQIMEILEYYNIDIDDIEDPKGKMSTESILNKIEKGFMMGMIEIDATGDFKIIQNVTGGDPVIYSEITGANRAAMDGHEDKETYGKLYALMGSLSGLGESAMKKYKGKDLSMMECLGLVFLGV